MSFQIGHKIGDYEVVDILGTGGMGQVYKVRNVITERFEAMKVLLPDLAADRELADRFLHEIKLLATLDHPNIASLRTAVRVENQLLMIMELVEGQTLARTIENSPLPVRKSVDYISQVLRALSYAHGKGIIHRDIKPANMMLTPAGVIKLMDFGIAKASADQRLTRTGTTMGSLAYMSPEQIRAEPLDARSDLYSLGASLYEIVTSRRPFQGDSDYALMAAHLEKSPVPPIQVDASLPPALSEIIMRALAKDPAQRFESADAFRRALESVIDSPRGVPAADERVTAVPVSPAANRLGPEPTSSPSTTARASPGPGACSSDSLLSAPVSTTANTATAVNVAGAPEPPPAAVVQSSSPPFEPQALVPESVAPVPVSPQGVAGAGRTGGYRGFYMTAGALVAILVIVIGAVELPKWHKTKAGGAPNSAPNQDIPPAQTLPAQSPSAASSSASAPATTEPFATQPATTQSIASPGRANRNPGAASQASARNGTSGQSISVAAAATQAKPAKPALHTSPPRSAPDAIDTAVSTKGTEKREDLKDRQKSLTQLDSRAHAIQASFEKLAESQQAQGLSPSPDRAASLERMNQYLALAHDDLVSGDAASAGEHMDLAEREVEALEKFFGR